MPTPPVPRAVSISEAARSLGVSRTTFYRILTRKEIKSVRTGRRILIPVRELDRFLDRAR